MQNKDVKITRIYEGKYGDFSLTVCIKAEDVTEDQKKTLRAFWTSGETVDISLNPHNEALTNQTDLVEELEKKTEGKRYDYNAYRLACLDRGIDYNALKKRLGVEHLQDLEYQYNYRDICVILDQERDNAMEQMGYWNNL